MTPKLTTADRRAWKDYEDWQQLSEVGAFEYRQRMSAIEVGENLGFIESCQVMFLRIDAAFEQHDREKKNAAGERSTPAAKGARAVAAAQT